MMRNIFSIMVLSAAISLVVSCSGKNEKSQTIQVEEDEWAGMDEFHMAMAESFHPFRDSSNVEPARIHAKEMVALADQWIAAERPAKVDNDDVTQLLTQLRTEAANLAELVGQADDEQIGSSLTNLHDIFHHLQEKWYHKGEVEQE